MSWMVWMVWMSDKPYNKQTNSWWLNIYNKKQTTKKSKAKYVKQKIKGKTVIIMFMNKAQEENECRPANISVWALWSAAHTATKQLRSTPYEPLFLREVILIADVVPAKALIIFLSFPILTDFYSFSYDIKMPMNLLGDINYLIKNRTKPRRTWCLPS